MAAVQHAFGDTPEQQVADTGHSFCADNNEIGALLCNGREQLSKRRTRRDNPVHFPANTSERIGRSVKCLMRPGKTLLVDLCNCRRDGGASVGRHHSL